MITGKTSTGFGYKVEDEILDDYELLELLNEADNGKAGAMIDVVERVLGEEQVKALKDHIRNESGRVSAKRMITEVMEILKSHGAGKN